VKRGGLGAIVLFGLFALVWTLFLFFPLVAAPSSTLPDDGDALQGVSVLAWVSHQLVRAPLDIFDSYLYYPHPLGLVYSEHLLPHGALAALLMALGANVVAAANFLIVIGLVSIALAVFLWARELGATPIAAAVAGLVCAFGTATVQEAPRLQMLWMQWIPLGLYCLHRFFVTGSRIAAWGFAVCFVLQGLCSQYFLVSFPIYLAPIVLGYLYLFPERRDVPSALRLAVPFTLTSLVLIPIELPYLTTFAHYRFNRPVAEGTDLLNYLLPTPPSLLYGDRFPAAVPSTIGQSHFIGFVTLALALLGAFALVRDREGDPGKRRYRLLSGWFGLVGLSFLILSAGPEVRVAGASLGTGPFQLFYDYVPFFDYTRVPERLSVYWVFGLALLAGYGASWLVARAPSGGWLSRGLAAMLLVAVPLEHARRMESTRVPTPEEFPEVYGYLNELPDDGAVLELPVYPRRFLRFFGYETYFGTQSFQPRAFGKASFTPPALEVMLWTLRDFPSRESTRLLQALDISRVIYHPHRDSDPATVTRRMRRDPNFRFVRGFPEASPLASELRYGGELLFDVVPASLPPAAHRVDTSIAREGWSIETSSEVDGRLAIDGSIETSWSTVERQRKGHYFNVDLGGERWVSRITLGFVSPYGEFPRALEVNGFHPSHRWRRLELENDPWRRGRLARALVEDPASATLELVLVEPMLLQEVRLFIRETDLTDDLPAWKIPEIEIFETSQPE